jgi:hypothetical protein
MEFVKGRLITAGEWVHVYRNLNRNDSFSIRSKETGLVVGYCNNVQLKDATFHVSEKGRATVLKKRVRNVHAYVLGRLVLVDVDDVDVSGQISVYYNPFKTDAFIVEGTIQKVTHANYATVINDRVYIKNMEEELLQLF